MLRIPMICDRGTFEYWSRSSGDKAQIEQTLTIIFELTRMLSSVLNQDAIKLTWSKPRTTTHYR